MRDPLVLVDSSVWIDYYHPRGPQTLKHRLQEALGDGAVATIGLIAAEVLQGAPSPSALAKLQEDFLGFHWLELTQDVWLEAGHLGARLRQGGLSIPVTDIVIAAAAIHHRCQLWHRDTDFTRLARHAHSFHAIVVS